MSEEINADMVRAAVVDPDPMMEALTTLLKTVATEAVAGLSTVLGMLGVDPRTMPGTFFAQAILVAADGAFLPISREDWITVYDSYEQIKEILVKNPDIREELAGLHAQLGESDPLLDGEF